jgi:hypothetical protein
MYSVIILRYLDIQYSRSAIDANPLMTGVAEKIQVISPGNKSRIVISPVIPVSSQADICLRYYLKT